MLNFEELELFVAFADYGTLTKAAEVMHISQPTLTRAMKHMEESFGVSLFTRGKNRIELNDTGLLAVERARLLLSEADDAVRTVKEYDKSKNTIVVESCAPAPLWIYLPELNRKYPAKTISSEMKDISEIIEDVRNGNCTFGIIPCAMEEENLLCKELITENLSVVLTKDHPALAGHEKGMPLSELNGHNCLLRSQIGFWDELCRRNMPASRFLVQSDDFEFFELIKNSSLPFFVTNLVDTSEYIRGDRVIIPITDPEANVTYHLISKK